MKNEGENNSKSILDILLWPIIVGIVVAVVSLYLEYKIDIFYPKITPTIIITQPQNETQIQSGDNVAESIDNNQSDSVLFEDDFNDGKADGWSPMGGDWKVVKDESGNYVYQAQGIEFWAYNSPTIPASDWQNYTVEARFRIIQIADRNSEQASDGSISIRGIYNEQSECYERYETYFDVVSDRVMLARIGGSSDGCPYKEIAYRNYDLELNQWYTVRIEALGSSISVDIDGFDLFDINDTTFTSGKLELLSAVNGIVQFDDVKAMAINE